MSPTTDRKEEFDERHAGIEAPTDDGEYPESEFRAAWAIYAIFAIFAIISCGLVALYNLLF